MIYVGTSGYGYPEWKPDFYPAGMCYEDYLKHYAKSFTHCELRSTFFRTPSSRQMSRIGGQVPEEFRFTVKLDRRLTHERSDGVQLARKFAEAVAPLTESGQLASVLAQFPFSFVNNPHSRAYLCRLRAALELPLVVELRNDTWAHPETLAFLNGWGIGLAALDAPLLGRFMPRQAFATSSTGYVRFLGRSGVHWWSRRGSSRYDYRYRQRELVSWIPRVREIARRAADTFVVFNNYRHAYAVANAAAFRKLLDRSQKRRSPRARARAG